MNPAILGWEGIAGDSKLVWPRTYPLPNFPLEELSNPGNPQESPDGCPRGMDLVGKTGRFWPWSPPRPGRPRPNRRRGEDPLPGGHEAPRPEPPDAMPHPALRLGAQAGQPPAVRKVLKMNSDTKSKTTSQKSERPTPCPKCSGASLSTQVTELRELLEIQSAIGRTLRENRYPDSPIHSRHLDVFLFDQLAQVLTLRCNLSARTLAKVLAQEFKDGAVKHMAALIARESLEASKNPGEPYVPTRTEQDLILMQVAMGCVGLKRGPRSERAPAAKGGAPKVSPKETK
jgi:hypothetical protein